MKQLIAVLILITTLILTSCTDNERARNFGGKMIVTLNPGERMVNMTWKQDDLWILTKQDNTKPSTYTFQEKSSWSVMEGTITVVEQ
jgi:uncharacterized lipoprotein YehR (DUF1307 family)